MQILEKVIVLKKYIHNYLLHSPRKPRKDRING